MTTTDTAADLAARLQMMILGATGAAVRVIVGDQIMVIADTAADRDAAQAFILARPGFELRKSFDCRGTWRATFRPAGAAAPVWSAA